MSSTTGLPRTFMTFVAYLFGWISGLVVLLVEKSDSHVRFHATIHHEMFSRSSKLRPDKSSQERRNKQLRTSPAPTPALQQPEKRNELKSSY